MHQHQIRIEPSSEERYVRAAAQTHAGARRWSETAITSGLEGLLSPRDRAGYEDLIRRARTRSLLTPDGSDMIRWLAETCARRIAALTDHDAPATRSKAGMLHDSSEALHALAAAVDDVLDLEEALRARQRIMPRPGQNTSVGLLPLAAACTSGEIGQERIE